MVVHDGSLKWWNRKLKYNSESYSSQMQEKKSKLQCMSSYFGLLWPKIIKVSAQWTPSIVSECKIATAVPPYCISHSSRFLWSCPLSFITRKEMKFEEHRTRDRKRGPIALHSYTPRYRRYAIGSSPKNIVGITKYQNAHVQYIIGTNLQNGEMSFSCSSFLTKVEVKWVRPQRVNIWLLAFEPHLHLVLVASLRWRPRCMHLKPGVGLVDAELPDGKSQERLGSIPCT